MRIFYISPYRTDKNIGKSINEAVKAIDFMGDDWFVLTDHDTLWLLPDSKAQVERILDGTDFDILGCMTNRIRSAEQLIGGRFNEDDRIGEHIKIAASCQATGGNKVVSARGVLGAFMLCFRVSVFMKSGGFHEGVLNFDSIFCREAIHNGFKVGIMQGVYVWHSYRLGSINPKQHTSHLTL